MKKLTNFVVFSRSILDDLRSGKLTKNEFDIYVYIRLCGNPYGEAAVSLDDIRNDVFRGSISRNYVEKLVLSLKRKRYIAFAHRKGRRGSFKVKIDEFLLASGYIQRLGETNQQNIVTPSISEDVVLESEVKPKEHSDSHTIRQATNALVNQFSGTSPKSEVRSPYNDNENENKNKNNDRSKVIPVNEYKVSSNEEMQLKDMASFLRERTMGFIISAEKEYGIEVVQRAFNATKERMNDTSKPPLIHPAAFFNKMVGFYGNLGGR